ncbi:hypothetical protein GH733_016554 [Mirounga leonina]|nr:hypothetical protein GH733_016554 [Mirounga leonina]
MKFGGGCVSSCEDPPGLRLSIMRSSQSKAGSVPGCSRSQGEWSQPSPSDQGLPPDSVFPAPVLHLSSFLTPMSVSTEEFVVIGSSDPTVAVLGGSITLPCRVFPAMNVENMELRWFRSNFTEAVFIYQNQQEQREEQLPQYTGRTSLVKEFLTWGEAILHIHNVQAFDDGLYTCFFRKGSFYESANLELKVAGRWVVDLYLGCCSIGVGNKLRAK